ncbi:MAG: zinc ribbon domain-containing protein [Chloroflexota bacterium]
MPIFEFACNDCGQPFEELLRNGSDTSKVICPSCSSQQVKKRISTFASRVSGGSSFSLNANTSASCSTGST